MFGPPSLEITVLGKTESNQPLAAASTPPSCGPAHVPGGYCLAWDPQEYGTWDHRTDYQTRSRNVDRRLPPRPRQQRKRRADTTRGAGLGPTINLSLCLPPFKKNHFFNHNNRRGKAVVNFSTSPCSWSDFTSFWLRTGLKPAGWVVNILNRPLITAVIRCQA